MIKRRVAAWFIGWVVLVGFQFLVYLHRLPFYQGDFSRRGVAGYPDFPIRFPNHVRGVLWDSAPVILFPLRNVVLAAFRTGLAEFYAGKGWQGLIRHAVFPFPPPARNEWNDAAHQAQHLKHRRREALWFSTLNSFIWVICLFMLRVVVCRARRRHRMSVAAKAPENETGESPEASGSAP